MKGLFDKKRQGRGRRPKEGGLTREIAGIIIGLVAGTVALCWVLNTVFLERYYVMNKENVLLSGFTTIDAASEDGSLDDSSFDVTFDNLCANGNITVMVISPDRTIVRSSVNDTQRMLIEFTDIIFGGTQNETTVLAQAEDYVIQRRTDTRLDAEYLVILTAVEKVAIHFGKPDQQWLSELTVEEAKKYMEQGQFGEGDMLPKIEAAINFIGDSAIRSVLITKLNKDGSNIHGGMGTMITK